MPFNVIKGYCEKLKCPSLINGKSFCLSQSDQIQAVSIVF